MPRRQIHQCACPVCSRAQDHPDKTIHHQFNLLLSRLDEQQRRWLIALESKKIGHGGDRFMARVSGISVETIRRGRRELDGNLQGRPTARVRLPGAGRRRAGTPIPTEAASQRGRQGPQLRTKTLLVEDEAAARRNYQRALAADGHEVSVALTGNEALRKIEEDFFDVALVNLKVTDIGGFNLVRALRKAAPHTEIIVVTASPSIENAKESIRLGAFDYLTKPFDADMIRNIISQALTCRQWALRKMC